jgi:hypothetical protein
VTSQLPQKADGIAAARRTESSAKGRNRYRDSPLRGGAPLIALRLGRASISGGGGAIRYGGSSQIFFHRSACATMLQSVSKIAAFTWCEVMRILVSRQPLAPGRASRRRRSVHVSHSSFVGLEQRFTIRLTTSSRNARVAGLLNSLESQVTPEPLSPVYSSSVPARPGCVRCRPAPGRRQHQTLEGSVDIVGRRAIHRHQRRHPDQTGVEPAATSAPH